MENATTIGAILAFLGLVIQTIVSAWGSERARRHEYEMTKLKLEHQDGDKDE